MDELTASNKLDQVVELEAVMEIDLLARSVAKQYVKKYKADLGIALEGGAHIRNLRRTKSGGFGIRECDKISEATLRPVLELVRDLDRVVLTDQEMSLVRNGGRLVNERTEGVGPWALTDSSSNLIAVHEKVDGQVVVGVVLPE